MTPREALDDAIAAIWAAREEGRDETAEQAAVDAAKAALNKA